MGLQDREKHRLFVTYVSPNESKMLSKNVTELMVRLLDVYDC